MTLQQFSGHDGTLPARACSLSKEFETFLSHNKRYIAKHRKKDIYNLYCEILDHHVSVYPQQFFVTIVNEISVETDKITVYTVQYQNFELCILPSRQEC